MRRHKKQLTLGDVIQVVSQYSHNPYEMRLAVADLLQRGVVRPRSGARFYRVIGARR
jgi:hypothetical protein